jgi:hypothetical protein
MTEEKLPRGIWYEAPKRRFRVRKYHNKVSYLKGYYRTFSEAQDALQELEDELALIPKLPKRRRGSPGDAPVHSSTLSGTVSAIRNRQHYDPKILERRKT